MGEQLREAAYVLVIASAAYKRRAEGRAESGEGRGVQHEAALIRDEVYRDRAAALKKYLPVLLPGRSVDDIPEWLGPTATTHYKVTELSVQGAERLPRVLTGQPPRAGGRGRPPGARLHPTPGRRAPRHRAPAAAGRAVQLRGCNTQPAGRRAWPPAWCAAGRIGCSRCRASVSDRYATRLARTFYEALADDPEVPVAAAGWHAITGSISAPAAP